MSSTFSRSEHASAETFVDVWLRLARNGLYGVLLTVRGKSGPALVWLAWGAQQAARPGYALWLMRVRARALLLPLVCRGRHAPVPPSPQMARDSHSHKSWSVFGIVFDFFQLLGYALYGGKVFPWFVRRGWRLEVTSM